MNGWTVGAVLLAGFLLGRRRSGPPAPAPQSTVSAKGVLAIIVLVTGVLFGATVLSGAAKSGAPKPKSGAFASIFGGLPKLPKISLPQSTGKPSPNAQRAVRFALAQRGDRYLWGGNGPNAWDCSGLTQAAWRHAGVEIPGTAKTQLSLPRVKGKVRAGDLIVYRSRVSPSGYHVAIAVGQGQMVEARGRRHGVTQGRIRGGWLGVVRPGVR